MTLDNMIPQNKTGLAWGISAVVISASAVFFYQKASSISRTKKVDTDGTEDGKRDLLEPPVAPVTVWEALRELSGNHFPWFILDMSRKFPSAPVFRLNLPLGMSLCFITDARLARKVLINPKGDKIGPFAGTKSKMSGTVNIVRAHTRSQYWKKARKGVSPAFAPKQVHRMNQICLKHLNYWIRNTLEPLVENGGTFDPAVEMTRLTTKVICEAGFEYVASDDEVSKFLFHVEKSLKEFSQRQSFDKFRKYFGYFLFEEVREAHASSQWIRDFCYRMIRTYREKQKDKQDATDSEDSIPSVMKLILENTLLSEKEIMGEIMTYLVAGYDTTGYTLGNALVLLAENAHFADKLREDLRRVGEGNYSHSDYLHFVMSENFRMFPVAAVGSSPRALPEDVVFENYCIPAGSWMLQPFLAIHRNPAVFDDPDKFNPDRWETASPEMKQSLLSFSLGARNCVGQSLASSEIQSVLPKLIAKYRFKVEEKGCPDYFLTLKLGHYKLSVKRDEYLSR